MSEIFVGRKEELALFDEVLAEPAGQAVLVVGHEGLGKTSLLNEMARRAAANPDYRCGFVRYEVTPTDATDLILTHMMEDAHAAAILHYKLLVRSELMLPDADEFIPTLEYMSSLQTRDDVIDCLAESSARFLARLHTVGRPGGNTDQWQALFEGCGLVPAAGDAAKPLAGLAARLRCSFVDTTHARFVDAWRHIGLMVPDNGRALLVVDPEGFMQPGSDRAWAALVLRLPPKVKILFAQRCDDVLASSAEFRALANVRCIPSRPLRALSGADLDDLYRLRADAVKLTVPQLRVALARYEGHPFSVQASLDLLADGLPPDGLPADSQGIAQAQWRWACGKDRDATRLLKGHAILEVPVPGEIVDAVAELDSGKRQVLTADPYLAGLFRQEGEYHGIGHTLLADYIREQLTDAEARAYHCRARDAYRARLTPDETSDKTPDELAARRLPDHALQAQGPDAFVAALVNESWPALRALRLFDEAVELSERALALAGLRKDGPEVSVITGNLGNIYIERRDLDRAEKCFRKALEIDERLDRKEGLATNYGNLAVVYMRRGDPDRAEQLLRESLQIEQRLGRLPGMAHDYANLGAIYKSRGDLCEADRLWAKARDLFAKACMFSEACWLDFLRERIWPDGPLK